MPMKSIFRIDLGELDPHFERYAAGQGMDVAKALALLLTLFLRGQISVKRVEGQGRKFRSISLESNAHKEEAQAFAASHHLSLGRAIRLLALDQMMSRGAQTEGALTNKNPEAGGFSTVVGSVDNSRVRIELRPTRSELDALTEKAKAEGYGTVQDLVAAVLRSFLINSPVLGPNTAAALGRANLSLVRIGTNLNQMARVLNGGGILDAADVQKFTETMAVIEEHTREIAGSLSAARGRWSVVKQTTEGAEDGEIN